MSFLCGSRLPILTECPSSINPSPSLRPTSPDPNIPIFIYKFSLEDIYVLSIKSDHDYRYDIPKSKIIAVGRNVILDMDFPEIFNYKVSREAPLPSGEPAEKIAEEV